MVHNTILSIKEIQWLKERRITRLTDNQEVLIYPMGAERYLSLVLAGKKQGRYPIHADIEGKDVLVIPGYGNTAFIFAHALAKSVTVFDKDPVTIAWVKAFKKYYHFREAKQYPSIGELLSALTNWYPPCLSLPSRLGKHWLLWALNPKALRRTYIFYLLTLVNKALELTSQENYELDKPIAFHVGELATVLSTQMQFDTAYVPYLLGVKNGIEQQQAIIDFIKKLLTCVPTGQVIINPTQSKREFHVFGKRYITSSICDVNALQHHIKTEDKNWFKTQGLAVFSNNTYTRQRP